METLLESATSQEPRTDYFSVAVAKLRLNTTLSFDLFLPSDSQTRPTLYRDRDLEFTEDARLRLIECDVKELWVPSDQKSHYNAYMEGNVRIALSDDSLTVDEKTVILYETSCEMIREFLEGPSSEEMVSRTRNMVSVAVEHLLANQFFFGSFLKTAPLNYETYTHSVNVSMYTLQLAQRIGYDDPVLLEEIGVGTYLHDIGKCRVPQSILNKPGELTAVEWRTMRKHPSWGHQILSMHGMSSPVVLSITRDHHEHMDGAGYPFGVPAGSLPDYVRMTTICDIFDALSTKRVYKERLCSFNALEIMKNEMHKKVDQDLFSEFVRMLHI